MNNLDDVRGIAERVLLACLLGVLLRPVIVPAQGTPLSLAQVEKLVEIHSPDDLIAEEIKARGLNYAPDQKTLDELQRRGAGQATLSAVRERIPIGTLEIQAPPGSQIVVDGTDQGVTDAQGRLVLSDLPAGAHRLSVRNAGYKTGEFSIILAAKEYKHFPVNLDWAGGYLTVRADPAGATIDIPGLGHYKDSISDLQCPPGTYDLTVSRAGVKPESRSVVVAAGQHAAVEIHLVLDPQSVQNQLLDAKQRLADGDPHGAIQVSNDLLVLEPDNPDADSVLAGAYLQVHDLIHFQSMAENAIRNGGTIVLNLVHEHLGLSGDSFHPASLTLTEKTIAYDPMGAMCKYHAFTVPISNVELSEVTDKSGSGFMVVRHLAPGTFLLHLEISEPGKSGKRMTFYFATSDSQIVSQNGVGFLASPSNSPEVLDSFAELIKDIGRVPEAK